MSAFLLLISGAFSSLLILYGALLSFPNFRVFLIKICKKHHIKDLQRAQKDVRITIESLERESKFYTSEEEIQ